MKSVNKLGQTVFLMPVLFKLFVMALKGRTDPLKQQIPHQEMIITMAMATLFRGIIFSDFLDSEKMATSGTAKSGHDG